MPKSVELINDNDVILITGASGFIGRRVIANLLVRGFQNLRCLVRTREAAEELETFALTINPAARIHIIVGNLLSPGDCELITEGVALILHLAAGRGEKSFADAFLNSVVTTKNLLQAVRGCTTLRRIVNVSSFTVYTNDGSDGRNQLDEDSPTEQHPEQRGDPYCFAKSKQEQILLEYGRQLSLPYVIVRPGYVYGPGNESLTARVGIGTFGIFMHLGGGNPIPMTYVDNCAEAIVLAGIRAGVDGEIFNVVDDDIPTSRTLIKLYKSHVRQFRSIYLPHFVSYMFCSAWERYSKWSKNQLPPVFNRRDWCATWRRTRYSNEKLKRRLGWTQKVRTEDGMQMYFHACRELNTNA